MFLPSLSSLPPFLFPLPSLPGRPIQAWGSVAEKAAPVVSVSLQARGGLYQLSRQTHCQSWEQLSLSLSLRCLCTGIASHTSWKNTHVYGHATTHALPTQAAKQLTFRRSGAEERRGERREVTAESEGSVGAGTPLETLHRTGEITREEQGKLRQPGEAREPFYSPRKRTA